MEDRLWKAMKGLERSIEPSNSQWEAATGALQVMRSNDTAMIKGEPHLAAPGATAAGRENQWMQLHLAVAVVI